MNNFNILQLVNVAVNRDINTNFISTAEFQTLLNANSKKLFRKRLGVPEEYARNAPVGRQGVGITKENLESLKPFYTFATKSLSSGILDLTTENPAYIIGVMPNPVNKRGVDEVTFDEYQERAGNALTAPTADDPLMVRISSNQWNVYPATLGQVDIAYYKFPTDAVVSITNNATTKLPEYNSAGSTELEWNDVDKIEIAYMLIRDAGVAMERNDVVNYAEQIVSQGA